MLTHAFDSGHLPAATRLPAFRAGARDFEVAPVGDPAAFSVAWRLLALGDVNLIHSRISPLSYRRDRALIQADGVDRITIHYYLAGGSTGLLDDKPATASAGAAMVWDLARPIDVRSTGPCELLIVTLPRHMMSEVLPADTFSGVLPPTPELALAGAQARDMIDHAAALADDAVPFFARAVRDLFAVAMLPVFRPDMPADEDAPLFRRILDLLDGDLRRDFSLPEIGAALETPEGAVSGALARLGGLAALRERRRLLAAYRLLGDPADDRSIASIARQCGFDDQARFSRRFREAFDITPSVMRRDLAGHLPRWAGAYHVASNYGLLLADGGGAEPAGGPDS